MVSHLTYQCPGDFQFYLSVLTPGLLQKSLPIQTSHGATPHPYLRNGPHGEGAHVSAASSGSPAQEAVPSSAFPTLICTLNLNETVTLACRCDWDTRRTWGSGLRIPTRTGPKGSSQTTGTKMDTPPVPLPHTGSTRVGKSWRGAPAGPALCMMPVDLYMTPLIL